MLDVGPGFITAGGDWLQLYHSGLGRATKVAVQRVRAYIDGFNLYHGTQDRYGLSFHWLDPQVLARCLLRRGQRLERVSYFTARLREQHPGRHRQDTHLQAITAHCPGVTIIEGRFQEKSITCRACAARWNTYEEKETDVSLAVSVVEDTALDQFDVALVVSADSDMVPAIRAVRRLRPRKRVIAVFPPRRHSDELARHADRVLRIDRTMLNRSQLPVKVVTQTGVELVRPERWS